MSDKKTGHRLELENEISARLTLTEDYIQMLRIRFRALPEGHKERAELRGQLQAAAAVCGAFQSLLEG